MNSAQKWPTDGPGISRTRVAACSFLGKLRGGCRGPTRMDWPMAVTILRIDPGTYVPSVARGRSRWPVRGTGRPAASAVTGLAITEASNVGEEARARTWPVRDTVHHDRAAIRARGRPGRPSGGAAGVGPGSGSGGRTASTGTCAAPGPGDRRTVARLGIQARSEDQAVAVDP